MRAVELRVTMLAWTGDTMVGITLATAPVAPLTISVWLHSHNHFSNFITITHFHGSSRQQLAISHFTITGLTPATLYPDTDIHCCHQQQLPLKLLDPPCVLLLTLLQANHLKLQLLPGSQLIGHLGLQTGAVGLEVGQLVNIAQLSLLPVTLLQW